jgi:glycosyltransferase involved in cell wall biosynthesis
MPNPKPLVSIGIPTYNRPLGLHRVLQEVTSQTYSNIEIIISDNHSPESETETIARKFMQHDQRIRYFRQDENIGSFNNYMFLFEQSQGEYFTWLCDDDFRSPDYIESCMNEFERLKSLILVNSYSTRLNAQGEVIATDCGCTTIAMRPCDRYIKYISTIFTTQAAIGDVLYGVIKREFLKNAIDRQVNIIAWDHPLLAYLTLVGEFYTIPKVLMSASDLGVSSDDKQTAKAQLIEGSMSEKMPFWTREIQLQKTIKMVSEISQFEKFYLSAWSYIYYFLSHGFKMWVKRTLPDLFYILKKSFKPKKVILAADD